MLDQSFSAENFYKIFYIENRKGTFNRKLLSEEYLQIHEKVKLLFKVKDSKTKEKFNEELDELNEQKDEALRKYLEEISEECNKKSFCFKLDDFEKDGKVIYTVKKDAPSFFAMKQLQYNIAKTFKVKQSNRYDIVKQLRILLEDGFPKYIIRIDVKGFYESIPQDILLKKFEENQLLNYYSKKLLKSLIFSYEQYKSEEVKRKKNKEIIEAKSKEDYIIQIIELVKRIHAINFFKEKIKGKGVPRGVGVSAYLSELYMRDIDNEIKSMPDLVYYSRYVDDIILAFIPPSKEKLQDYYLQIDGIIKKHGLTLKDGSDGGQNKTFKIDLLEPSINTDFDFLGYKFVIENSKLKELKLSDNKLEKYDNRLKLIIDDYNLNSKFNEKSARKLLISRFKFLTGNFHLLNNRKKIKSGIYYSNILIKDNQNPTGEFKILNNLIRRHLAKLKPHPGLKVDIAKLKLRILKRYSFEEGFYKRDDRFHSFKNSPFKKIVSIWKN